MTRLQSPMKQLVYNSPAFLGPKVSVANTIAQLDRCAIEACRRQVLKNPNINANLHRWEENIPTIQNIVLRNYLILNPRLLVRAVDTTNAVLHLSAPEYAQALYTLTNLESAYAKKLPDIKVSEHDETLYMATLHQPTFSKKSQPYPTMVPGTTQELLRRLIDIVHSKICVIPDASCEEGKKRIFDAIQSYKELMASSQK